MSDTLDAAVDIIKRFEGCELSAYRCPAGVLTIGYGHTGSDVMENMTIDNAAAVRLLWKDLMQAMGHVLSLVTADINDNQRAALASFCFNVGCGNLASSTLLARLNAGAPVLEVADEFLRWDKAGGKVLAGLVNRRKAERDLFLTV